MLKPAILYDNEVQKLYTELLTNNYEKYKFTNFNGYVDYKLHISDNEWCNAAYVSVLNNNTLLGYMALGIDRGNNYMHGLFAISFLPDKLNPIFSRDLIEFIYNMFTNERYSVVNRKIESKVIVGNPAEKMWDKFVIKLGGTIHHYSIKEVNIDNRYYDVKYYEILKENFKIDYIKQLLDF